MGGGGGGTASTGRGGASEAGGAAGASGAVGDGKPPGRRPVVAAAGTDSSEEGEPDRGLPAGDATGAGAGASEGDETAATEAAAGAAAAAAAVGVTALRSSAVTKPGRRKSTRRPSRSRMASRAEAPEGSGGGGMESVSLTTSVEVTVLDGLSVGEERHSSSGSSDGAVGGSDEAACGKNSDNSDRPQSTSTASEGVELPPLKIRQPGGSTANSTPPAGVGDGEEENAEGGIGEVADRSSSAAASLVSREDKRAR